MKDEFKIISKSPDETDKIAKALADALKDKGILICLYGDIGAGKTTFTKFLAKNLGIKEKVTSPSFVILNEYHTDKINLYHFDLYRLEEEGINTILDELHEYTENDNSIALIEWAEFSSGDLPDERLGIKIKYLEETEREFIFRSYGNKCQEILYDFEKNLSKSEL
ncbi:MAG: tRNA (adenosine(37)-N6)-threonylcarbamoyltransferase complex ATPase subunit type 1 TsaE [Candidatus Gastranaerophilales bacterium]|nr:tRNA (adenosine(37)-N6)-threonylcarbamoyltransferase complex ATPase subunit type 1 TsaE [Candidatus Gastranaerophilales bacterium]